MFGPLPVGRADAGACSGALSGTADPKVSGEGGTCTDGSKRGRRMTTFGADASAGFAAATTGGSCHAASAVWMRPITARTPTRARLLRSMSSMNA